jgi:hypothetical protein
VKAINRLSIGRNEKIHTLADYRYYLLIRKNIYLFRTEIFFSLSDIIREIKFIGYYALGYLLVYKNPIILTNLILYGILDDFKTNLGITKTPVRYKRDLMPAFVKSNHKLNILYECKVLCILMALQLHIYP